ncbi:MAG: hypothetical protein LBF79_02160 [Dysgonamonadaceae bacterium]|jgi:hypothetical protein|nr:hypothetical protein [Dysgonamonadaceae bacterium]
MKQLNTTIKTILPLICVVMLLSCEEIKNLTTLEIPVKALEINFNAATPENIPDVRQSTAATEPGMRTFNGKDTIKIDSEEFEPYAKYANLVKLIKVSDVKVTITSDNGGSVCKNVTLKSSALNSSWSCEEYALNTPVQASQELNDLIHKLLDAVLQEDDIDFEFYGETDAPNGSKINIKLTINGVLTVQLLKD